MSHPRDYYRFMKLRAIFCCTYFSIAPWWIYEKKKHYERTYWKHLKLNWEQAMIWLTGKETEDDIEFEKEINPDWMTVLGNMVR